ncbi:MAG: GAF domain-containing protein [Flavobacteriales bacterium]
MTKKALFSKQIEGIKTLIAQNVENEVLLKKICQSLHQHIEAYDWVGFYFVSETEKDTLVIGPYCGEKTEHTKIPFGKGLCGQTAKNQSTTLSNDVSLEANYIACDIDVKSEIVVPLFNPNQELIGQIDIDSKTINTFDSEDDIFLKEICSLLSHRF